jgi:hypothetical protein
VFLLKITATKESYEVLLSDATFMLATSHNVTILVNYLELFGMARFCEKPNHQEQDNTEGSSCIWEHVTEKISVTFTINKR